MQKIHRKSANERNEMAEVVAKSEAELGVLPQGDIGQEGDSLHQAILFAFGLTSITDAA